MLNVELSNLIQESKRKNTDLRQVGELNPILKHDNLWDTVFLTNQVGTIRPQKSL